MTPQSTGRISGRRGAMQSSLEELQWLANLFHREGNLSIWMMSAILLHLLFISSTPSLSPSLPFAEPPQLASETSFIKPVFFFATCFPKHPLGWRTLRLLDHGHLAPPLHSNLFLEPCPGWSSLTSPAGRPPWNVLSASVGGIALIPCRCVTKCDKFKMICWR